LIGTKKISDKKKMLDKHKSLYILGANGFLGRQIANFKTFFGNQHSFPLNRADLDFLKPTHFFKYDFTDSLIIDCIANIDGSEMECNNVNIEGLNSFLSHLKNTNFKGTYVYFSTLSVINDDQVNSNYYVKSKKEAEVLIKNSGLNYKIIRLTFPFGIGESNNRLITRLIKKIKNNEDVFLDDVSLSITPINYLLQNLEGAISSTDKEINFTDGNVYKLKEIVDYIKINSNSSSNIHQNSKKIDLTFKANTTSKKAKKNETFNLIKKMID
jgi:nucleoside-diphosphate-sugar epimerase